MSFFTRPRHVFLLAGLCCLLWGSAYPAIKQGYGMLGINRSDLAAQILFAGYRFVGAGALLLVLSSASLYGKRLSQRMDSVVMTGYQLGIGGFVLVAIGWVAGGRISSFSWAPGLLLAYMALLSAVAFALWGTLLKYNRVSTVALYSFLVPVFGAGLSALFLGESLWEWKYLVALLLVSLGIYRVTQEQ